MKYPLATTVVMLCSPNPGDAIRTTQRQAATLGSHARVCPILCDRSRLDSPETS